LHTNDYFGAGEVIWDKELKNSDALLSFFNGKIQLALTKGKLELNETPHNAATGDFPLSMEKHIAP